MHHRLCCLPAVLGRVPGCLLFAIAMSACDGTSVSAVDGGRAADGGHAADGARAVDSAAPDPDAFVVPREDGGPPLDADPCPTEGACRILPLGDSITDATFGGYRIELFRRAVEAGAHITFVGSLENGPLEVAGQAFPRNHEGHGGWQIAQIDELVPSPALDPEPHIVLLHIGTNDIAFTPDGAAERLATLLDHIFDAAPNALVAVARIIPNMLFPDRLPIYNAGLTEVVDARIRAGRRVILVDQNAGFPETELADGVHPNEAGYARMGGVWFESISSYLH
jgi:lysophospholipase L1-like esterase